jgi:ubiquinone/menaquinone biosynthesis C-methylase UbiE
MSKARMLLKLAGIAVTSRSTRVFYDRISPFYDSLFTDHLSHIQKMVAVLAERFSGQNGLKVLDLACGTGALSWRLKEHGFSVTGLDFSFQSLRRLARKAEGIPVVQADAGSLPFEGGAFDIVTCMGAWRHFPHPRQVLEEICRVLRPDGMFFVGYFPPKLGGVLRVPNARVAVVFIFLYGWITRMLNYTDKTDRETERQTLRMIDGAFEKSQVIQSEKNEYLILAESRR